MGGKRMGPAQVRLGPSGGQCLADLPERAAPELCRRRARGVVAFATEATNSDWGAFPASTRSASVRG
ncbi:MAG: hypothetical protein AVDCRST_MAG59-106 [uncultured Thermomicrobiales bacterium]|uniref:Uncharacterized protein n=1 Tax=uncultured Thermomicrobiales bacterium TaxID=1645740 RepID=A0A6J4TWR8_9BACT|nr:MAG: hypothetical protein AVDCRST_MAG59-106 [uncultured Thermomicrobiales bacterium]